MTQSAAEYQREIEATVHLENAKTLYYTEFDAVGWKVGGACNVTNTAALSTDAAALIHRGTNALKLTGQDSTGAGNPRAVEIQRDFYPDRSWWDKALVFEVGLRPYAAKADWWNINMQLRLDQASENKNKRAKMSFDSGVGSNTRMYISAEGVGNVVYTNDFIPDQTSADAQQYLVVKQAANFKTGQWLWAELGGQRFDDNNSAAALGFSAYAINSGTSSVLDSRVQMEIGWNVDADNGAHVLYLDYVKVSEIYAEDE